MSVRNQNVLSNTKENVVNDPAQQAGESMLPEGYKIRLATTADMDALQDVDVSAARLFSKTDLIDEPWGPVAIPTSALEKGIKSDLLFVADSPFGDPVGFALASERRPDLYLDQISVHTRHGQRGVGTALVQRVIKEAELRRLKGVCLSTFRDVAWNGPFYAKLGFVEIPRSKMKNWMKLLEKIQSQTMDISLRCFMRRPGLLDSQWTIRSPKRIMTSET